MKKRWKKIKELYSRRSIRLKLIATFLLTMVLVLTINVILYNEINNSMKRLDAVYDTNVSLNELTEILEDTQEDVLEYLNTKSSDSLEDYYRNAQRYQDMLELLNDKIVDNKMKILEKNIRSMSRTYLSIADETIQAKRGRNVERYKEIYDEALKNYQYIRDAIYCLNNMQFQINSSNYQIMLKSLDYMELISNGILRAASAVCLLVLTILIGNITRPLSMLAKAADDVAAGNFDSTLADTDSRDEIGVVTHAFVKMMYSIRNYIEQIKESMEKEQKMKERELLMETHLKDAQLKYLQAQINPHFLFNSLNAGAQLAMMEDAEKTSIFIEKMADYFRYNVRKTEEAATLAEEIEAVDNYVYILNVRFSGDIHFEKEIEPGMEDVRMPSMILQPIVENAVNHGIRDVDWEGRIWLTVKSSEDGVQVSIRDNGQGMTKERIAEVLEGKSREGKGGRTENVEGKGREGRNGQRDSTGIGMDNVISRMELFYGRSGLLQILSDGPGTGTEIRFTMPWSRPGERQV